MNRERCYVISRTVFDRWANILAEQHSTPLLALGVGHGTRSGQIHLCVRDNDDLTDDVVRGFLAAAIAMIDAGTQDHAVVFEAGIDEEPA